MSFDIAAFCAALDREREARGLTWAALFTPAIPSPEHLFLSRAPASFPRWDTAALHAALDDQRAARKLTWRSAAREIGEYTPAMLRNVQRGVGFPMVMRLLDWLRRPAADFVVNVRV